MKYHQYLKIKENLDLKINYLNAIWKYFEWEKVNFVRWRENILKAQNRAVTDEQLNKHEMVIGQLYPHLFLSSNLTRCAASFAAAPLTS
jgi:hypothetical protein